VIILKIIIDSREPKKVIKLFQLSPHSIEIAALECGDFYSPEKEILIERKTYNDLISSIKDNRLFSQLERASNKTNHLFLLITMGKTKSRMNPHAVWGALARVANLASILFLPDLESAVYFSIKLFEKFDQKIYHPKVLRDSTLSEKQRLVNSLIRNIRGFGQTLSSKIALEFESIDDLLKNIDRVKEIEGISESRYALLKKLLF